MRQLALTLGVLLAACGPAEPAPPNPSGSSAGTGGVASAAGATGAAAAAGMAQAGSGGAMGTAGAAGAGGSLGGAGGAAAGAGGASGGAGAGGGAGTSGSAGSGGGLTPLPPCSDPSVSRLKVWEMQVVGGTQVPASGSPLRPIEDGHELYVEWTLDGGGSYGTANAPLNNQGEYTNGADPAENGVDISAASGVTLEYATTGSAYMQIRTASVPHGGDHFRADLPPTDGELAIVTLNFEDFRRPGGNTPPEVSILQEVFSFTFVGASTTTLTLRQVLVPGYSPPCD